MTSKPYKPAPGTSSLKKALLLGEVKIEPCPKCSSPAEFVDPEDGKAHFWVACTNPKCLHTEGHRTLAWNAFNHWNALAGKALRKLRSHLTG